LINIQGIFIATVISPLVES